MIWNFIAAKHICSIEKKDFTWYFAFNTSTIVNSTVGTCLCVMRTFLYLCLFATTVKVNYREGRIHLAEVWLAVNCYCWNKPKLPAHDIGIIYIPHVITDWPICSIAIVVNISIKWAATINKLNCKILTCLGQQHYWNNNIQIEIWDCMYKCKIHC